MIIKSKLPWIKLIIIQGVIISCTINHFAITFQNSAEFLHNSIIETFNKKLVQENTSIDSIAPEIIGSSDMSYLVNTTGHNITWYISDKNPLNYSILHNYLYIETERNKTWSENQTVIFSVDNLLVGIHLFTIIVEDLSHNTFSDDVVVMVGEKANFPTFTTTNTEPADSNQNIQELFILGLILAVIILVSMVIVENRRNKKRIDLPFKLPPEDALELEFLDEQDFL